MVLSSVTFDYLPHGVQASQIHSRLLPWLGTILFIHFLIKRWVVKRQRLVPGVPIVGGDDRQSIQKNRIRFIHDGKSMLEEGYKKVQGRYHLDSNALTYSSGPGSFSMFRVS
jgi:hypothetical protein